MHPLVARLDAALAANYPTLYEVLGPGSPKEDLDELEQLFGMPLPELYREFLGWRSAKPFRVYPRSGQLIFYYEMTSARRAIEKLQMMRELWADEPGWREAAWWGEFYLPLMEHGGPELVIDMAGETVLQDHEDATAPYRAVPGQVVEFHHADEFRHVHAPSLAVWLEAFALACERKVFTEVVDDYELGRIVGLGSEYGDFDAVLGELASSYPHYLPVLHRPHEFW